MNRFGPFEVCKAKLSEEDFSLEFLTGRGSVSTWQEAVGNAVGENGVLVQERIFGIRDKSGPIIHELLNKRDSMRFTQPLLLPGTNEPVRFAGLIARSLSRQAVLERTKAGFALSTKGFTFFFGVPLVVTCGTGDGFAEAFERMGRQTESTGMGHSDLVRTWIYMSDIDCDYKLLNDARKKYFSKHYVPTDRLPASTGVQGSTYPSGRISIQGWYASGKDMSIERVASPLQREPTEYGVLFSRALAVQFKHNKLLLISGTAAIDPVGASLYLNDCHAQICHTINTVLALLDGQGGRPDDIVQMTIYVKDPRHLGLCLDSAVLAGFPKAICIGHIADICRSDLLCEIEATAVIKST